MDYRGKVSGGVVVLEPGADLPEGAEVRIEVLTPPSTIAPDHSRPAAPEVRGARRGVALRHGRQSRSLSARTTQTMTAVFADAFYYFALVNHALTGDHHFEQAGFVLLLV